MNSYFCSAGLELAIKIKDFVIHLFTGIHAMNNCNSKFYFENIQDQYVTDAMAKIKTSKALEIMIYLAIV